MRIVLLWLVCMTSSVSLFSQQNPDLLHKPWPASWLTVPNEPPHATGAYCFRKVIELPQKPASFVVYVSADNRYKLYVNGTLVSLGPARGDVWHWRYATVDIGPYLVAGKNTLAAAVWQFGDQKPMAQMSFRLGFILQGKGTAEQIVNTDKSWKCIRNPAYRFENSQLIYSYYVVGPEERIDYRQYPHRWEYSDFDDTKWKTAQPLYPGLPKGADWTEWWLLVPDSLPAMERTPQRFASIRTSTKPFVALQGTLKESIQVSEKFTYQPSENKLLTGRTVIPAHKKIQVLLDQGTLTNAYPVLNFSGGKDARITLRYAEALYVNELKTDDWRVLKRKDNRSEVAGKYFSGPKDIITVDGGANRIFQPLWLRTFRYVLVEIETAAKELIINDFHSLATGYPFQRKSTLQLGEPTLQKIDEVGWRTARLCALETYVDCPFYEQLQYVGDTRIQALISLYNTGDDRLMRNALQQLDHSRIAEGITQSRYPSAVPQEIPPFSLWWIGMLHDYWMYRPDTDFVKQLLPGSRQILHWFLEKQHLDGSLKKVPYWNFADWSNIWPGGRAPSMEDGHSAVLDLQLLWALQLASELERTLGMPSYADLYDQKISQLQTTIQKTYWDTNRKLYSDTPEKKHYSQHANILAVLTHTTEGKEARELMERILPDTSLIPASIYFKYYLHRAVHTVGLGDRYADLLDIWKKNLALGMTTWGEDSYVDVTRSDCHAWGAHPTLEFYRIVLGIDTGGPGFKKIRIEPWLGRLSNVSGSIPHPNGTIRVSYNVGSFAEITLPTGTEGEFIWKGKHTKLTGGQLNKIRL